MSTGSKTRRIRTTKVPRDTRRRSSLAGFMKCARGVVDSGIPDLASNPKHLAGFGRDARHR
jgi:hypothetical protein